MRNTLFILITILLTACGNANDTTSIKTDTTAAKTDSLKEKQSEEMTEEVIETSFDKLNR